MNAKGSAIKVPAGTSPAGCIEAVKKHYEVKLRSPRGWYGQVVVNVEADERTKGDVGKTYIVKALANGFEVYGLIGTVTDKVKVVAGEFIAAK